MAEYRMYTKEEVAKMTNNDATDLINELVIKYNFQNHKTIEQEHELERFKSLLKGSELRIEEQRKVIDRYRTEIDKLKEEIRELKEKPNKDEQDTIEKLNTIGYAPVNFVLEDSNSSYSEYAIHLMRKYEALTDHGFSHDDAMCLIPMWDDADFENFKKGN